MGIYFATVRWRRNGEAFLDQCYSRAHDWVFDGGVTVPASASPHIVPLPHSVAEAIDPEEAFVASISSCHMLFFLSLAAGDGILVDSYEDRATGHLEKNPDGELAMTRVVLRPEARYGGDAPPAAGQIERLHHRAHEACFIAKSVLTEITTEIVT